MLAASAASLRNLLLEREVLLPEPKELRLRGFHFRLYRSKDLSYFCVIKFVKLPVRAVPQYPQPL
jgi:hypothetical protein